MSKNNKLQRIIPTTLISSTLLMFSVEIEYDVKDGDRTYTNSVGAEIPQTVRRKKTIGFWTLLFMSLGLMSTSVTGLQINVPLLPGSPSRIGNYNVLLKEASFYYPLSHVYDTFEFWHSMDSDYYCTKDGCSKHGNCGVSSNIGVMATNYLWASPDRNLHFHINYCQRGTPLKKCFFTEGCWRWYVDIMVNPDARFKVFRVNPPRKEYSVDLSKGVQLMGISLEPPKDFSKYTVIKGKEQIYLCPYMHNFNAPIRGALGDLQVDSNGGVNFALDSVSCTNSFWTGPSCSVASGTLRKIIDSCYVLPMSSEGWTASIRDDQLVIVPEGDIVLKLNLPIENPLDLSTCGGMKYRIIGSKYSPHGGFISMETRMKLPGKVWIGRIPCTNEKLTWACDSPAQLFPVRPQADCLDELKDLVRAVNESGLSVKSIYEYSHPPSPQADASDTLTSLLAIVKYLFVTGPLVMLW